MQSQPQMVVKGLYFEMLPRMETSRWDEWIRTGDTLVEVVEVGRTVQRRTADGRLTADRERIVGGERVLGGREGEIPGCKWMKSGRRGERKNSEKQNLSQRACA